MLGRGGRKRHLAIIGATDFGDDWAYRFARRDCRIEFVGIFDDPSPTSGRTTRAETAGTVSDLVALAAAGRVDQVMIALPGTAGSRIAELVRRFQPFPVDVMLCSDQSGPPMPIEDVEATGDIATLKLLTTPFNPAEFFVKTMVDKVISAAAIVALFPIFLLIVIAIKLDSPGPVFFRQKRYGYRNRIFAIYKFRTMYHERTDEMGIRLTERNDPRLTRVGRLLRRLSLDELPQLLNVVKGEMSMVGPRPHPLGAAAAGILYTNIAENYTFRQRVKPGLTGWAQVNGWRGPTDTLAQIENRLAYDIYYIENWSIFFDLRILFRSAMMLVRPPSTAC